MNQQEKNLFATAMDGADSKGAAHRDFGWAINMLKFGHKVARAGWNGKGMHLWLARESMMYGSANGARFQAKGEPCIVMFTADKLYQPGWLASQADMLATDWEGVE